MKIKNAQIINSLGTLSKINSMDLDIIISMKLLKLTEAFEREHEIIEKARQKLLNKHGSKDTDGNLVSDDDGRVQFDEGNDTKYLKEWNKLCELETEVDTPTFSLYDLQGIRLSPKELAAIKFLIADEE